MKPYGHKPKAKIAPCERCNPKKLAKYRANKSSERQRAKNEIALAVEKTNKKQVNS